MITTRKQETTNKKSFKPSKYQEAIYKAYENSEDNLVISATAGSGKTTTLLELLKQTPDNKKVVFLAFNKSIQRELEEKVPDFVDVKTIHSMAFTGVLRKHFDASFNLNNYKTRNIMDEVVDFEQFKEKGYHKSSVKASIKKLYDLYRMNLASSGRNDLISLADMYNVDYTESMIVSTQALIDHIETYNNNLPVATEMDIDYTDMLWLVYKYIEYGDFPKYDIVMVDEVQDLNPLQKAIVDGLLHESSRFIAVGDKKQMIYSFQGSNLDSFRSFEMAFNTQVLPLSVTYRCGYKIAEEANQVFEDAMEPFEKNPKGIVRSGDLDETRPGDYVICRNNKPLVDACLDLITDGKKCFIKGRDFAAGLFSIINRVKELDMDDDHLKLDMVLQEKKDELRARGVEDPESHKSYLNLEERISIIRLLLQYYPSLKKVGNAVNRLYQDKGDGNSIILMTGHKSKGLENDRIFWLEPELIKPEKAKTPLEEHQEKCLKFVIITRAKKELVLV